MRDEKELQHKIEANPSNPGAYYNLGIYYDQQEKYDDAIRMYRKVLELDSDRRLSATVNIYLARICRDNQDLSQAIKEYQKAFENASYLKGDQDVISHLISKAHYELGMVYYEEALKSMKKSYLESAITEIREALNLGQKLPNEDWIPEAKKNLEAIMKGSKRGIIISDKNHNIVGTIPGDDSD